MFKYVLKRLGLMLITLFLITTVVFFMLKLMPGSPFNNPKLTIAQRELLEAQYGLNDHPIVQYGRYLSNLLRGDFGSSFKYNNVPVLDIVLAPLATTARIGIASVLVGTFIGVIFGSIAALKKNTGYDHAITLLGVLGVSVPSFVIATGLVLMSKSFDWMSVVYQPANESMGISIWDELLSMGLPITALSVFVIASVMRYMRSELVEVLNSDYILLARAKGLQKTKVIYKHAIRNALIPVITIIGPMTVFLISGSTVVERFFGVPGLSQTMIQAIGANDYFLIIAIAFFYSVMLISVILVVDLLYGVIDPRIRVAGGDSHE